MDKEKKLKLASQNPEIVQTNELIELNENLEKLSDIFAKKEFKVEKLDLNISGLKEIRILAKELKNITKNIDFIKGKDGRDGKDGKTPTKQELESLIYPIVEEEVDNALEGVKVEVDTEEIKESLYKQLVDNLPQFGNKFRDGLELLPQGERLLTKAIEDESGKGLDEILEELKKQKKSGLTYVGTGGGTREFIRLLDTPDSYTGQAGKAIRVKSDERGLEFYTPTDQDERVKASSSDTTAGYLDSKVDNSTIEVQSNKLQVKVDSNSSNGLTSSANGLFVNNIYNSDGTLNSNRNVDLNNFNLGFINGNVGIGTNNPTYKLQTSGGSVSFDKNNHAIRFHPDLVGYNQIASVGNVANNYDLLNLRAAGFKFTSSGGYDRMVIEDGGNVGIGTTNPRAKLHVLGNTLLERSGSSSLTIKNTVNNTSGYGDLVFQRGNGSGNRMNIGTIGDNSNGVRALFVGGNNGAGYIATFTHSGNVGIGTTTPAPTTKLHLKSTATFEHLKIEGIVAGIWFSAQGYDNGKIYYDNGGHMNFHTNGSEKMRITVDGRVGIGTAVPQAKLDVNGSLVTRDQSNSIVFAGDINGARWLQKLGGYMLTFSSDNPDTTSLGTGDVLFEGNIYRPKVAFTHNGSVLVSGSIGVGTLNPTSKLEIVDNVSTGNSPFIKLINTSGATPGTFGPGIIFDNFVSGTHPFIINQRQDATSRLSIANAVSPYTEYLTILQNGNVGVLDNNPQYKLSIDGSHQIKPEVPADPTEQSVVFYQDPTTSNLMVKISNGTTVKTYTLQAF